MRLFATTEYGARTPLDPHGYYNRFVRWSRLGVFARIFRDLANPGAEGDTIMIDSTHLKAHRTAASLAKGGRGPEPLGARRAA